MKRKGQIKKIVLTGIVSFASFAAVCVAEAAPMMTQWGEKVTPESAWRG